MNVVISVTVQDERYRYGHESRKVTKEIDIDMPPGPKQLNLGPFIDAMLDGAIDEYMHPQPIEGLVKEEVP